MFPFLKNLFASKEQKAAPKPEPVPVPDDTIRTIRDGLERKRANRQKLRETLNGCLPKEDRGDMSEAELVARLATAASRSRR